MSLSDFFSPIDPEAFSPKQGFLTSQLGLKATFFTDRFPELEDKAYDIAIFGVLDDRGALDNNGCALGAEYFRAQFYALNEGAFESKIIDLGNILAGKKISDTYFAVKTAIAELVKLNILPVI